MLVIDSMAYSAISLKYKLGNCLPLHKAGVVLKSKLSLDLLLVYCPCSAS